MAKKSGAGDVLANVLVIGSIIIFAILFLPKILQALKNVTGGGSGKSAADGGLSGALKNALSPQQTPQQAKSASGFGSPSGSPIPKAAQGSNSNGSVLVDTSKSPSDFMPWLKVADVAPVTDFGGIPTGPGTQQSSFEQVLSGITGGDFVLAAPDASSIGFGDVNAFDTSSPEIAAPEASSIDFGSAFDAVNSWIDSFSSPDVIDTGYQDSQDSQPSPSYYDYADFTDVIDSYDAGGYDPVNFY